MSSPARQSNPLTAALLDTIAIARDRAEMIAALRELLRASLDLLNDQQLELDWLRARYHDLLTQRRPNRRRAA